MKRLNETKRKVLICDPISFVSGHHVSFNYIIINAAILEAKNIKIKLLLDESVLKTISEKIPEFSEYFDYSTNLISCKDSHSKGFIMKAKWLKTFFLNYIRAFKLTKREKYIGIFFTDFETISFFVALLFFKLLNMSKKYFKIGIVVHNSIDEIYSSILFKGKIKRFFLEYIFLNVDVIVVLEEYIKKQALNIINSSLEKKFIVAKYPVLDMTNSIINETHETSRRRIFFVGTASKSKGIDLLLEALKMLDAKYYKFLEIGIFGNIENTKLLMDYEEVLKKIKVRNEFIPHSEYYEYIRQAEYLFMLQTKYQARVSGALFDAFSFNKPVISISKILRYYEDYYGPLGFVIPADVYSLCSTLISIARREDKEKYIEFIKNIEKFKKDHSLEQFYIKIREVIRLLYE